MAAVGRARVGEREHVLMLHEPRFHFRLQHRLAPRRAVALAVDDANAAVARARRLAQKGRDALVRFVAAQAVQVDLVLQHPDATAELAHDVDADAMAPIRQRIVGLEQRLGVDDARDRFGESRRFVALALARKRRRAGTRGSRGRRLSQRDDVADGVGERALVVAGSLAWCRLRRDEAHERVSSFLREATRAGYRCVRVVHGKGHGSPGREPVLKAKVKAWLVKHQDVLAFTHARPADGGHGALIVLLKANEKNGATR